jgi:hypothetical protein
LEIIEASVRGYPSHDFVIDLEEARELGLPARPATKEEVPIVDQFVSALYDLQEGSLGVEHAGLIDLVDASKPTEQAAEAPAINDPKTDRPTLKSQPCMRSGRIDLSVPWTGTVPAQ